MDTGQPLAGQVAVVTGAGRGIGAAIARKLAELGATAVLCGRTQSTLDATAQAILNAGGKTEVIPCDVTDLASGRIRLCSRRQHLRPARHPGQQRRRRRLQRPLHNLPPEDWDRILNTNLRGVYYAIRAFAPLMIRAVPATSSTFRPWPEKTLCPTAPPTPLPNGD